MEWREPPPIEQPHNEKPEPAWAKQLVSHPGKWAMVEIFPVNTTQANSAQSQIKKGSQSWQAHYPGRWEATYRTTDRGRELYVRYLTK